MTVRKQGSCRSTTGQQVNIKICKWSKFSRIPKWIIPDDSNDLIQVRVRPDLDRKRLVDERRTNPEPLHGWPEAGVPMKSQSGLQEKSRNEESPKTISHNEKNPTY